MLALAAGLYLLAKRFPAQVKPAFLLTICGIAALAAWMEAASRPDGKLHILVPGLDNSHAVIILTPRGQAYLINGAASGRELTARVDARLSPFERRLDGLILTDDQASPLAGLTFLAEQVQVNSVLWGGAVPANSATRKLESTLRQDGAKSSILEAGQTYQIEPGLVLRVLASGESGTALVFDYENFSLLLPGGFSAQELKKSLRRSPPSFVLLGKNDLVDSPPAEWNSLPALGTLWNDAGQPAPENSWIRFADNRQLEVTTDGITMSLAGGK
jgi:hypothetical protein